MKTNTKNFEQTIKQIEQKVREIWKHDWRDIDVEVEVLKWKGEGAVKIKVSAMYETPSLTFDRLNQLSEYFGTTRIDTFDEFGYGGCETCDYGSCYGFILIVLPPVKQ